MAERFYPQERRNTCAVASLRSVLANQFGVHVREDVLRFAGDTAQRPILMNGSSTVELRRMLGVANRALNEDRPWKLRVRCHGRIADLSRELRAGRYPITSVTRYDGWFPAQHAVVVCGYKRGRVRYFDPKDGRTRWCKAAAFRKQWLDVVHGGLTWYAVVTGGTV